MIIIVFLVGGILSVQRAVRDFYKVGEPEDSVDYIFLGLFSFVVFFLWPILFVLLAVGYIIGETAKPSE